MDACRQHELNPQCRRFDHRTDQVPVPSHHRRDTITTHELGRQIEALEQNQTQLDPALPQRFEKLQHLPRRFQLTAFSLFTVAVLLVMIALATASPVTALGGIAAYLTALGVHDRHLRKLARTSTPQRTPRPIATA